MEAKQFVAGLAIGTALVIGGKEAASFDVATPAEVVVDIGEATVALDGLVYGRTIFAEVRRRRAEDEQASQDATAASQANKLPVLADEWLGLHTLQARVDKAAQRQDESGRTVNSDSAAFLRELVADLSQRHRKLGINNQFIAVLDGVQEVLVNEYTGAFLMPVPGTTLSEGVVARQRRLEGVFDVLDWAAPITPTVQGSNSSWRSYIYGKAMDRIKEGVARRHLTVATSHVA